jgi:predicted GNAT family acetyltransferase
MNWYKKAQLAQQIQVDREYPVAAAIIAADRIFEGRNHGEAIKKAIEMGYAKYDEDGYLVDRNGKDMLFDGSVDLFRTNKGRIINRFKAFDLGEATGSEQIPEAEVDTLDKLVKKHESAGLELYVYDNGKGTINLSMLKVPKKTRKQGLGTAFMNDLCAYADRMHKEIELNLGEKETGETTSRGRLIEFYKRFGFVRNFGRTKDYSKSCQMYRKPR